jgi:peptide/nickel transport system permease protein
MLQYLRTRLLTLVPVLFLMSVLVFGFIRLIPGDPADAMLGIDADASTRQALRHALGVDRPIPVQYALWLGRMARGDFGRSIRSQQPVWAILADKFPVTLELTAAATAIGLAISLPLGVVAAVRRNTGVDFGAMVMALGGVSIPSFWLGVMLILLFSLRWRFFPSIGYTEFTRNPLDALRHLILPAVTLGLGLIGALTRMVRSGVLEEQTREYVRSARAKGLSPRAVITGHILRNALLPTLTVLGTQVSVLLGGAVITEQIFGWPGLGQLAVQAVLGRDYPVLQGTILVVAVVVTIVQLLVDVGYALLDPRIRFA